MSQYFYNFMLVSITLVSTSIVTPSLAETPLSSNKDTVSISSQLVSTLKKHSNSSTNSKPVIISDSSTGTSASKDTPAPTKPDLRVPIYSRVFSAPSMQQ